jgi:1-acyl-sn-glycerol-3-phosphate acyltransferase
MDRFLKHFFFSLIVKPVVYVICGVNMRFPERLPKKGPAILVANHNSHMDTVVLMSLFPSSLLNSVRPAAAADYFLSGQVISWFSTKIIGIIPIQRNSKKSGVADPFAGISECLENGDLVIFFPEGTRGKPEEMSEFKSGIAKLAERFPEVPVVPFFLHGLGKTLPRGEALLVPFFCDVAVGEPLFWGGSRDEFLTELRVQMADLAEEIHLPAWD